MEQFEGAVEGAVARAVDRADDLEVGEGLEWQNIFIISSTAVTAAKWHVAVGTCATVGTLSSGRVDQWRHRLQTTDMLPNAKRPRALSLAESFTKILCESPTKQLAQYMYSYMPTYLPT